MFSALLSLVRDFGLLSLGLLLLCALPQAVFAWFHEPRFWWQVYAWIVDTVAELIILAAVQQRALAHRSFRESARQVFKRYPTAVGTNILGGLVMLAAMMLLCVPAFFLAPLLSAAIPIAIFEGQPPHRSLWEGARRVRANYWPVLLLTLSMLLPSMTLQIVGALARVPALHVDRFGPHAEAVVRVALIFALVPLHVPSMLSQMVVWAGTRPMGAQPFDPLPIDRPEMPLVSEFHERIAPDDRAVRAAPSQGPGNRPPDSA